MELKEIQNSTNFLLHSTVKRGDVSALFKLLNEGLDPLVQDENGQTPLHHAAFYGTNLIP